MCLFLLEAVTDSNINLIYAPLSPCDPDVNSCEKWSTALLLGVSRQVGVSNALWLQSLGGGRMKLYINIMLLAIKPHFCSEVLRLQKKILQSHTLIVIFPVIGRLRSCLILLLIASYSQWHPHHSSFMLNTHAACIHLTDSEPFASFPAAPSVGLRLGWWGELSRVTWGINCMVETCILWGMQGRCWTSVGSAVAACTDGKGTARLQLCYWRSYRVGRDIYCSHVFFSCFFYCAFLYLNLADDKPRAEAVSFHWAFIKLHCRLVNTCQYMPISTCHSFYSSLENKRCLPYTV